MMKDFKLNPDLTVDGMRKILRERYEISVTATKLYRARCNTKSDTLEKHGAKFFILKCYAHTILKTNLESITKIKSKIMQNKPSPIFERIFIAFKGSVVGFVNGCRPFIGFDGCHLKGPFRGILLSVIGLDASLQFFPIAITIVESENKESWKWFLNKLK